MRTHFRQVTINIAPVRVDGVGGVPLLVLTVAMGVAFPIVRWLLLMGAAAGLILGVTMILVRRGRPPMDPGAGAPKILFCETSTSTKPDANARSTGSRTDWLFEHARAGG